MSKRLPVHYPVTSVSIVSDPNKCPPGYELMLRSHDQKGDCDLWKDSMIRRTTRYLCFTRAYPTPNGQNNVLTGLIILTEKEAPPSGFAPIDRTIDSGEKACRKKNIFTKMSSREGVKEAIIDIIMLTKAKRAPEGYTLAGDVNGVMICYKIGPVPLETQSFKHSSPSSQHASNGYRPVPLPPVEQPDVKWATNSVRGLTQPRNSTLKRIDSVLVTNPLYDVNFQLNSKLQGKKANSNESYPHVSYRSLNDIKNEYDYSFSVEKSVIGQRQTTPRPAPRPTRS